MTNYDKVSIEITLVLMCVTTAFLYAIHGYVWISIAAVIAAGLVVITSDV